MMENSPLLTSVMKPCVILDTTTKPDGFGGYDEVLTEGAPFNAAIAINNTTEAQIAYQTGTKRIYTVVTLPVVKLKQGMKIRRVYDGLTLRITSNASDMTAPDMSSLKMAQVNAEAVDV